MKNNTFWGIAILVALILFLIWAFYLVPKWTENIQLAEERRIQTERVGRYEDYLARKGYVK